MMLQATVEHLGTLFDGNQIAVLKNGLLVLQCDVRHGWSFSNKVGGAT